MTELTITQAKQAKAVLEKEIARLIREYGNLCQCAIADVHVHSMVWDADKNRPVDYRVEVVTRL